MFKVLADFEDLEGYLTFESRCSSLLFLFLVYQEQKNAQLPFAPVQTPSDLSRRELRTAPLALDSDVLRRSVKHGTQALF